MAKGELAVVTGASTGIGFELAVLAFAGIILDKVLAEMHRRMAQPGGH